VVANPGNTKADTSTVTIAMPAPTLVALVMNPTSLTLVPGATQQFNMTAGWSDGSSTVPPLTWTATGGTVSTSGLYTAGTTAGTYRVIATQKGGGKADTSSVVIAAPAPTLTKLTIAPKTVTLNSGASQQFTVSALWSDGSTTVPSVTWSGTGGTITAGGQYTAGGRSGGYQVIVSRPADARSDTAVIAVVNPLLVTVLDAMSYSKGQYGAYASPWSTLYDNTIRLGTDYADSITIDPLAFTGSSVIAWHWPNHVSALTGVWGYNFLFYGNYDNSSPAVRVTPRQVKNITTLRQDYTVATTTGDFNVLNEFYLTSDSGNAAAKVVEIGYFPHSSASGKRFHDSGTQFGSFQDTFGESWVVAKQGTFYMLMPPNDGEMLSGSIDVKAALAFLIAKRVITGNEWFNGIALGVEPVSGTGRLTVSNWTVTYQ
jgi:hypothetical protein